MTYTLVIVESPSKAKTIAKYLGKDYVVRSTVGHIVDLYKAKDSIGVEIQNDFKPRYADIPEKKDVIKAILAAAQDAKDIIIASDPDREGEAIAFHVYEKVKQFEKNIKRAEFHEITKNGIQKGLKNTRELDRNLFDAQQSRRVLDRIVGFMVSPYLIDKLKDNVSAGRVQSVALRLIVDREKEINAFIPEQYWTIDANLVKNNHGFVANYSIKPRSESEANEIKKDLDSAIYTVEDIQAKEQKKYPLPAFNTADLQKTASSRLKFSADKTMKTAQYLYEIGAVSYIRTDSYRCSEESVTEARDWLKKSGYDLPKTFNSYQNKDSSQDAHEAIRPTNVNAHPDEFDAAPDAKILYGLIWSRFVASQMNPAIYDTVSVNIKAKNNNNHTLKANGKSLKYKGWLELEEDSEKSKDIILPSLSVNDVLQLIKPNVVLQKKETKPPSRYNDGSIIDELKKRGIGRPSTYASILSKISSRKYVDKVKNNYEPTDIGIKIVDDLSEIFTFMSYDFTAKMESDLDKMAEGKVTYVSVMKEFYKSFRSEFDIARNSRGRDTGLLCPICNSKTTVKHSRFGFFAGCITYPHCKGSIGISFEGDVIIPQPNHRIKNEVRCPKCESGMILRDGVYGPFYACTKYPECLGKRKVPFGKECPKCNNQLYLTHFSGDKKLACMSYPDCKHIEDIPDGARVDWIEPTSIIPEDWPKKIKKVLKKKVNYD